MSAVEWHMGRRSAASTRAERLQAAHSKAKLTLVTDSDTNADSVIVKRTPKSDKVNSLRIACFGSAPSSPVRPFLSQRVGTAGSEEDSLLDNHCHQRQTAFDIETEAEPISGTLACSKATSSGHEQPSAFPASEQQYIQDAVDRHLLAAQYTAFNEEPENLATSGSSADTQEVEGHNQDGSNLTNQV